MAALAVCAALTACAIHETRSALRRAFPQLPPIRQTSMAFD